MKRTISIVLLVSVLASLAITPALAMPGS